MNAGEVVATILKLLAPVIAELFDYLTGKTNTPPPVLLTLPDELKSEAALVRAKARVKP